MIKRLLIGIAGTPELQAKITYGLDLAQVHTAEIRLLSIVDRSRLTAVGPVPIGAGKHAEDLRQGRLARSHELDEAAIERFRTAADEAGIRLEVLRSEGKPLEEVASVWRYHDLCILGLRAWFDYKVMPDPENALQKLIARSVRPILAVPEDARPLRKALIAYNGSLESAKTMKHFVQMRAWPDAAIHLVCVGAAKSGEDPALLLREAGDYCRLHGFATTAVHRDGKASDVLLQEAAAAQADLIVMGSSYRRVLLTQRFGRNALALIKNATVPLFLSH